jgi:hypothetical protein
MERLTLVARMRQHFEFRTAATAVHSDKAKL